MEVCSLEEVTHWTKKKHLGSDLDPMEPGVANLIVVLGSSPWPCTLGLARVQVALNQKMCLLLRPWIQPSSISTERRDWKQLTIT